MSMKLANDKSIVGNRRLYFSTCSYIINCFNSKNPGQNSFPVLTQEFKR